jgi:hypothetical protein
VRLRRITLDLGKDEYLMYCFQLAKISLQDLWMKDQEVDPSGCSR